MDAADLAMAIDEANKVPVVEGEEEKMSARQMISAIGKVSGDTNVIKESMNTFSSSSMEGVTKKGDVTHPANDMPGAIASLKAHIETAFGKAKKEKDKKKWAFRTSPHAQFDKTIDDTYVAFLMWARVSADDDDDAGDVRNGASGKINVTKAFRRLETYADWMEETGEDLVTPPMTAKSVVPAMKAWAMSFSYGKDGQLIWWVDMGSLDLKAIKGDEATLTIEDSLRAFVWLAHAAMYDPKAQANGMAFVENIAHMGFWASMTMVPMKLGVKLDKLTMGVMPVKMKVLLCLDCPRWVSVMMKSMRHMPSNPGWSSSPLQGCAFKWAARSTSEGPRVRVSHV